MDEFSDCFICGRHPLVGEEVSLFSNAPGRENLVCDLCLPNPRAAALGEAVGRERIRSAEGAATVSLLIPVPVAAEGPARQPTLPVQA